MTGVWRACRYHLRQPLENQHLPQYFLSHHYENSGVLTKGHKTQLQQFCESLTTSESTSSSRLGEPPAESLSGLFQAVPPLAALYASTCRERAHSKKTAGANEELLNL